MTLKQTIADNFSSLLRCLDPSADLLGRLRSVPFVIDQISSINQQLTDDDKNNALLNVLSEVPDDCQESVMNGFVSALRASGQDHVSNIFRRESDKVPMSDEHYRTLTAKADQLCQFIDPGNRLLNVLVGTEVISPTDERYIRSVSCYNEMPRKLVEVLTRKSDDAFDGFIGALNQTGQSHVSYILTGKEELGKVPMSDEHCNTLAANIHQLCKFLDLENGLLDKLVSEKVVSLANVQYIRSVSGYNEMAQKLIELLTRKSDDAFDGFIDALNQTGQSHVTYMLSGQGELGKVPMSDEHYRTLTVKANQLCQFIDPGIRLLNVLVSTEVISPSDARRIRSMPGLNEMAGKLIEVLMRKSDDAFDGFIDALNQTEQSHVTYMLTGQGELGKVPMSAEHYRALTANIDRLCQCIDPESGLLDKLVSTNVISLTNAEYIRSGYGYNEVARKLVEVLMRKSDDAFDGFINALHQTGQSHVTYMLTGQGDSRPLSEERRDKLMEERLAVVMSIFAHDLVSTLISKGVFSSYDQQRVEARQTDDGRSEAMVDLIARKSQADFDSFIQTLQECNHDHIAKELIGSEVSGKIQAQASRDREGVEAELRDQMQRAFDNNNTEVKQFNELLTSDGISVPQVSKGSIIVKFKCRDHAAVASLQELYSSKKLDQLFTESFLPKFADKGLESLSLHIPDEEFQRCFQLKLMTDEHRELLSSAEDWLADKVVVSEELLDKLSLSGRRRQTIERAATHAEQVKTLLDIVSRQPDYAFTQLLNALNDTNQREAADIISGKNRSATKSEAFSRPSGKLFSL